MKKKLTGSSKIGILPEYSLLPGRNLKQVQAWIEASPVVGACNEKREKTRASITPQVVIHSSLATKRCLPVLEPIHLTCLLKCFAPDDKL